MQGAVSRLALLDLLTNPERLRQALLHTAFRVHMLAESRTARCSQCIAQQRLLGLVQHSSASGELGNAHYLHRGQQSVTVTVTESEGYLARVEGYVQACTKEAVFKAVRCSMSRTRSVLGFL